MSKAPTTTQSAVATRLPAWLQAELRSDHAGELGAVGIYQGILHVTKDPAVRSFALDHLATEREHLTIMEELVAPQFRSRLQWPWRISGWLIGALPAAISSEWVFATIATVETFVDEHYAAQLAQLSASTGEGIPEHIEPLLRRCREDEVQHQRDAAGRLSRHLSLPLRLWLKLVAWGSRSAVSVARAV